MKAPHFDTLAIVNERTTGAMLFGMGKVVKDCAIATAQNNGYVQYQELCQTGTTRTTDMQEWRLYMAKATAFLVVVGQCQGYIITTADELLPSMPVWDLV